MKQTTKAIGDLGEEIAVHFLRRRGYIVKERNLRVGHAEIDIVALTLRDVVFAEVKTRSYDGDEWKDAPPPSLAVNAEKQRLTRTAASAYLRANPTKKHPRMDVIEVWLSREAPNERPHVLKIHHIKAAY